MVDHLLLMQFILRQRTYSLQKHGRSYKHTAGRHAYVYEERLPIAKSIQFDIGLAERCLHGFSQTFDLRVVAAEKPDTAHTHYKHKVLS